MNATTEITPTFQQPEYEYGNHSPIEVIRLMPHLGGTAIDPHASLDHEPRGEIFFTEAELEAKVTEVADNYRIIGDPQATEARPRHFGTTMVNADLLAQGVPAVLTMSTSGSSLYDEKGNPNNEGNALELAYAALKNPGQPIIYVESPGDGNSTDLEKEEYWLASRDGKLVYEARNSDGKITDYTAFETRQGLARVLEAEGIAVSHVSANASGAHFSTALMTALPKDSVERAFLYNPSNISDRSIIGLSVAGLREIAAQGKYAKLSKDPLRLSDERKEMARRVMGSVTKRKLDQARASTHNPVKLWQQQAIFRRGNKYGQSAAVHSVASQLQHPSLRQTYVFPEFAAQYKKPHDFQRFMELVGMLGGHVIEASALESLSVPMGQYGHTHYPTVRQTLESYAFHR